MKDEGEGRRAKGEGRKAEDGGRRTEGERRRAEGGSVGRDKVVFTVPGDGGGPDRPRPCRKRFAYSGLRISQGGGDGDNFTPVEIYDHTYFPFRPDPG